VYKSREGSGWEEAAVGQILQPIFAKFFCQFFPDLKKNSRDLSLSRFLARFFFQILSLILSSQYFDMPNSGLFCQQGSIINCLNFLF